MVLSEKQREELHRAIADYLKQNGLKQSLEAFKSESNTAGEEDRKYVNLLEKKWTSVVRLQKKVVDLESRLKDANGQLTSKNS